MNRARPAYPRHTQADAGKFHWIWANLPILYVNTHIHTCEMSSNMSGCNQNSIFDRATTIISAHLSTNHVATAEVPDFMRNVFNTLLEFERTFIAISSDFAPNEKGIPCTPEPAAPIEKSISNDYIICLEDGRKLRMLKRYLMAQFGMTPEQYRAKWGLPADYPMVAPAVAKQRSEAARSVGLGKRRTSKKKTNGSKRPQFA